MNLRFDINDRKKLSELLRSLNPDTKPLWGKMKPQQMVEHLIDQVSYTNGKKIPFCDFTSDIAARNKQKMIYTNLEIPKNVILGQLPENYTYPDIETAINYLMDELAVFDSYFKTSGATAIHGAAGPLNYDEWLIWHGKHFEHHLKQFGLIPITQ